jgi:hypothetical protein
MFSVGHLPGFQCEQGPSDNAVQAFARLFDARHTGDGVGIKPYLMLSPSGLLALLPQALHPCSALRIAPFLRAPLLCHALLLREPSRQAGLGRRFS